ncbi:allergen Asp f 15 precursor [Coniophora puteana RWD-64-598 SS2]|uniref:Allergen Asp f 15 n=1 Tax=Coniophora puteana (strain RWD-64-598) TaxID=741705 RepID=A0A5M3N3Z9_CONPW|nr:allergen Asp f 15 precursor [Coniophora puteana RWD-64-598 SS2]EIW85585.1 allergen Asp f 15 precursor [Coniophora puteana RWD-64-598 SS2]
MFTSLIALAALALPAFAQSYVSVSYDTTYDNSAQSMDTVACSDGVYGLASKWPTFGSVSNFPYIGGAPAITGWDSPSCGTCWELTYSAGNIDETIYVTAIDVGEDGFNLSEEAMNALTDGNAVAFGRVSATVTQVATSNCGN